MLASTAVEGPGSPSGLMVEFIRQPAGVPILDLKPEFSWIVPPEAVNQSAFQILVASSEEKLEKNNGDIWDSKKILGNRSSEIEFEGGNLLPGSSYFWKVCIWDRNGNPTPWSVIQQFETGDPDGYKTTRNKFQTEIRKPVRFEKISAGHYFADFGKDAFGTLVLELEIAANDTITIHLGEKTSERNTIDRNPGGTIRYQKVLLPVKKGSARYTVDLIKDQRNTGPAAIHLPDSIGIITPFRYCEIENCRSVLRADNISQKAISYYFESDNSSFTSSDTILNKVWDLCKYSMKATSFAGIYVDGDRERIPYEADAYINQLGHFYTDREYSLARLTNEYFIDHPTWPTEWILQTVPMFYNDFMYTGNIESVREHYEELKYKTLASLAREDCLISSDKCKDEIMLLLGFANRKERLRDIVDWPPAQKDTGWKLATAEGERDGYDMVEINTVVNAFSVHGLELMSKLAGKLGEPGDSLFFRIQYRIAKESFNEKLLNREKGIYVDGESSQHSSLHANMMALAFNIVPEEYIKTVIDFIKSRGMACSVYGAQYLLEGLYNAGEADYAMKLLTATDDRSWWNMIKSGSTIAMEAWDIKYKPNTDWNHAWGAAPANIIPGMMWGVAPAEPGYSKAVIKPQLSFLTESSVKVPTIRGTIECSYSLKDGNDHYKIIIPGNMECDFIVTQLGNKVVIADGRTVTTDHRFIKLHPGENYLIFNY
jgi:alpha-L-rhamnosidase